MTDEKIVSFFIPSRNDSYMGESNYRLAATLNSAAIAFETIGALAKIEMVVCDWGSKRPLSAEEELILSPSARAITRFVVVPEEFAVANSADSQFPEALARNVCVHRASGTYLAATNADILFTPHFAATLLQLLRTLIQAPAGTYPDAFIYCSRTHIPYEIVKRKPGVEELMRVTLDSTQVQHFASDPIPADTLIGPIGDMQILRKETWLAMRAFDERLIYWGWHDIDLARRAATRCVPVDLRDSGTQLFHLEHYTGGPRTTTRKMNPQVQNGFVVNEANEHWGFSDMPFPVECRP